jgi:hypothetical protein
MYHQDDTEEKRERMCHDFQSYLLRRGEVEKKMLPQSECRGMHLANLSLQHLLISFFAGRVILLLRCKRRNFKTRHVILHRPLCCSQRQCCLVAQKIKDGDSHILQDAARALEVLVIE